jgi:polyphosphate kinase
MDRNFFRRIELAFPVLDKKLKARVIREGLQASLADNVQAWEMEPDGTYVRKQPGKTRHSAQEELLEALARENGG